MQIISLGYSCFVKLLINATTFNKQHDAFDWFNSFEFNKLILSIEDNYFDLLDNLIQPFPLLSWDNPDTTNIYLYSPDYSFRFPHEISIELSREKYKKRFDRFKNYKYSNEKFLFIRLISKINCCGSTPECLDTNYNKECYDRIIQHLPNKSKILLIIDFELSIEDKSKIYNKFYVVDDIILPDHIIYGGLLHLKENIISFYQACFDYIDNNFDNLDINIIKNFIHNNNIKI